MRNHHKFLIAAIVLSLTLLTHFGAAALSPEADKLLERARFEFETENYQDALSFADKAAALAPGDADIEYLRGLILFKLKQPEKALQVLEQVSEKNKAALIEVANIYNATEKYDQALIAYERALAAFPERLDLYLSRGIVYLNKGDYARAEADFNHVIKIDPKLTAFAYYHLALVSYKQNDFAGAKRRLAQAMELTPDAGLLKNCQDFLKNIEAEERARKPLWITLSLTAKYDDNVATQPLEEAALMPPGSTQDKGDWSWGVSLRGVFKVINRREYEVGLSYNFVGQYYDTLTDNNLVGHLAAVYGSLNRHPWYFRLEAEVSHYLAGGEDKLDARGLFPRIAYIITPTDRLDFYGGVQYRDYLDPTPNTYHYSGTANYYHDFVLPDRKRLTVRGGLSTEYDDQRGDEANDYSLYQVLVGVTSPPFHRVTADLQTGYGWFVYQQDETLYPLENRRDYVWNTTLRITADLHKHLQLMFLWTHTENRSNEAMLIGGADPFDYRRNVYTLVLTGTY